MSDDVPRAKPFVIAGVPIPRKVLYGVVVVALYVGGGAFAVLYFNHGGNDSSTSSPPDAVGTCWDGSGVSKGEQCSTAYDAKALYWAFGIDPSEATCERSSSYDWSDLGLKCEYRGTDVRMAVWNSAKWRNRRLLEYGRPRSIGRGLILQAPGSADRYLLRYDSQQVLLYASVKSDDAGLLNTLRPHVRSLNDLLYGVKAAKK